MPGVTNSSVGVVLITTDNAGLLLTHPSNHCLLAVLLKGDPAISNSTINCPTFLQVRFCIRKCSWIVKVDINPVLGQMWRGGEDEAGENAINIKSNREQITFQFMGRCHLSKQYPAGGKHETFFLMYYVHAHTPLFFRYLSCGSFAEFAQKHFSNFRESLPYISHLI